MTKVRLDLFDSKIGLDRGVSKIKEIIWYLFKITFFLSAIPYPSIFKVFLLRLFGAKIGNSLTIKPRVNIHMPWKLIIGDHVWIGEEVFILNFEPLTVGNQVCISQRAFLCSGNHDFTKPSMPYRNAPINLHSGCWIGASVFIGPGVTIGTDNVISAGSVVTQSILDVATIYKGNPPVYQKDRW